MKKRRCTAWISQKLFLEVQLLPHMISGLTWEQEQWASFNQIQKKKPTKNQGSRQVIHLSSTAKTSQCLSFDHTTLSVHQYLYLQASHKREIDNLAINLVCCESFFYCRYFWVPTVFLWCKICLLLLSQGSELMKNWRTENFSLLFLSSWLY